ncbi:MAG: hypothetical protein RL026_202 [Pseudomonadota bacterium]|jgi:hypothetical protein
MLENFCVWLQDTPFALAISENWFPQVESAHVVFLALVAGSIFIVDLRLLGLASRQLRVTQVSDALLPVTWVAFGGALLTGLLMFAANAVNYYDNGPFRAKMVLLLLAGLNMAWYQRVTFRNVAEWDDGTPSGAARFAGAASLLLWTGVIGTGRWIGFT